MTPAPPPNPPPKPAGYDDNRNGKRAAKGRITEHLTPDELALLQRLRGLRSGLHRVTVYKNGREMIWCAVEENAAKIERLAP